MITKSVVLCLHSEHSEFFTQIFVTLHYKEISASFSEEGTTIKVRRCFLLVLLSLTAACMHDLLKE